MILAQTHAVGCISKGGGGESGVGGIKEIIDFRLNTIRHLSRYKDFGKRLTVPP